MPSFLAGSKTSTFVFIMRLLILSSLSFLVIISTVRAEGLKNGDEIESELQTRSDENYEISNQVSNSFFERVFNKVNNKLTQNGIEVPFIQRYLATVRGNVIVFGDSLSDSGNTRSYTFETWPDDELYPSGTFADSNTWATYFASSVKNTALNYAYGFATLDSMQTPSYVGPNGDIPVPGIKQQMSLFENKYSKPANNFKQAVHAIIFGGAFDVFYEYERKVKVSGDSSASDAEVHWFVDGLVNKTAELVERFAYNVHSTVATSVKYSNVKIVVANMYPLELTPYVYNLANENAFEFFSKVTALYNERLESRLNELGDDLFDEGEISLLEVFDLTVFMYDEVSAAEDSGKIVDVPCITNNSDGTTKQTCSSRALSKYVFYDEFHITSRVHNLLAAKFTELLSK